MEKQRKYKVFSIIALMFAVVALSVGFAAFQKIMNISSSAEVKLPSEDNLKLTLYGAVDYTEYQKIWTGFDDLDYSKWSTEKAYAHKNTAAELDSKYYATIDNDNLNITFNNLEFDSSFQAQQDFSFAVSLKNNSKYAMYIYLSEDSLVNSVEVKGGQWKGICTASMGVEQTLVDDVCNKLTLSMNLRNSSGWNPYILSSGNYKLNANEKVVLKFNIFTTLDSNLNDLSFSLDFDPIKIEVGTTPASYYNTTSTNEDA